MAEFMDRIPLNDEQKPALVFAFYNAVFFSLLGLCLAGLFAVYQVLYMFLRPILWAMLVGTVLFPFKRKMSINFKGWLKSLDEEDRPLVVGVALLPLQSIKNISENVYDTALSSTGAICAVLYVALKILTFDDVFLRLLSWIGIFCSAMDSVIGFFTMNWVVAFVFLYSMAFASYICLKDTKTIHKKSARAFSIPIWIFLLAHISNLFGPVRVAIFAFVTTLLSLTSAGLVGPNILEEALEEETTDQSQEDPNHKSSAQESLQDKPKSMHLEEPKAAVEVPLPASTDRIDKAISGDGHLRIIGALCLILWTAHHDLCLIFVLIPFLIACFLKIGEHLGVKDSFLHFALAAWSGVQENVQKLINIVAAGSLRNFVKLLFTSDRLFVSSLSTKVDLISSICVMVAVAVSSLFLVLFVVFQVHGETVHLIKLGGNVVSSNPDWLRFAMNYTEGQFREHDIDDYVEQAYQKGRKWAALNIRSLADPTDTDRADHLEQQANLLIDNLYRMWEDRHNEHVNNSTDKSALVSKSGDWMAQIMSASNMEALKSELTDVITENYETVIAIVQSIWGVLLLNLTLLSTIVIAILSLVLNFGFDILNFLIEIIVFLTAVYYLLASSDEQWVPLKVVNDFTSSFQFSNPSNRNNGSSSEHPQRPSIGEAVESAISGVFVLSAKMSIFYGLYTYFVHSLFDLNVVFIPCCLASIFAAIPIVPPYVVGILGFFELFLVRGETVAGFVFALASLAPLFFADAAFYREIKGSHPYVTGLSVVGGIYWLGLQGAIIGPIILVCMIVLANLYNLTRAEFVGASRATASVD